MITVSDSRNEIPPYVRIPSWIPLLAFIMLAFSIGVAGYAIFEQYKKSITEKEVQNLGAIADLKVAQIVTWREEHRRRAEMYLHSSLLSDEADLWLREGASANERKKKILKILADIRQVHNYKTISLLDKEGAVRISTNNSYAPDMEERKLAVEAIRSQRVLFLDLHRESRDGNKITIDSVAPLRVVDEKKGTHIMGALLFQIDPDSFLYPMIQSWPTQSQSAETLLTRRDGDDILFLNEVRHMKGAALSLRIPLTNTRLPSVQAVLHQVKNMEGMDYRGIPVVAVMRSIPDTPWLMVSKIDSAELFAPINTLQRWVTGLAFLFAAFGGALIFFWFREHKVRYAYLKTQHDAALEREVLLRHFEYLTRYANDMIIVANEAGQIVEANERAQQAMGYSREELLHKHVVELHDPLDSPTIPGKLERLKQEGELRLEGIYQRKDGSTFPVEISARLIEVQGTRYLQGIIRDITERKRSEEELRESEARFRNMADTALALIWVSDTENLGTWFSKGWLEYTGRSMEQELGLGWIASVHPDDLSWCVPYCSEAFKARRRFEMELRLRRADGSYGWIADTGIPRFTPDGEFEGYIGYCWDITERKHAEEELWRQRRFIRQVIDTDPNLISVKDAEGRFLLVNKAMADAHGKAPQELIGQNSAEFYTNKAEAAPYLEADREVLLTRHPVVLVSPNLLGGKERWFITSKTPMVQPDGEAHVLDIAMDITQRKLAEEKLRDSYKELAKLTTHLEVVREDEQKRISRELHDEMGGVLAALNVKVSLLAVHPPAEMADLMTEVADLEKLVSDGIQALHRAVTELRPALLDEVGLTFAIERYVQDFEKNTEIECDLRLPEQELILDENQTAAIFRIVQESLTNVAKHAQASKISIVLSEWEKSLVLTVKDNGEGFDLNTQKEKSFGLLGIRERAAMVGGKAKIISEVGKGTTVRVSLPLMASRHEGSSDN